MSPIIDIYFNPRGRCSRKFYWLFGQLPFFLISLVIGFFASTFELEWKTATLLMLVTLGWPSIVFLAKRLHDLGFPGYLAVLAFVPYLGMFISFVVGLFPGMKGANRFGEDPRGDKIQAGVPVEPTNSSQFDRPQ